MPLPRRDVAADFLALCDVMTTLRSEQGCPWDRAQDLHTLRPYLLEEAHEVLEVLDALDADGGGPRVQDHKEELGDLLLQVVFQSEIQREHNRFDVGDVARGITDKLRRRHPHIFSDTPLDARTAAGSKEAWEQIKREERQAKNKTEQPKSALDGVPRELPGLLRAYRTGEKARGAGFDWPSPHGVIEKIKEELGEVEEALAEGNKQHVHDEIGDLLYAIVNLARHLEVDPEGALRSTISRFETRFRIVEQGLAAEGKSPETQTLDELERRWQMAKRALAAQADATSRG